MGKEFGKIVASIAITIGLNIILRVIVLPTNDAFTKLSNEIIRASEEKGDKQAAAW